ncbi:MAG: HRDC domain-containing protein [Holosporaceae bacterium]|jgi:ribonuclease D|nr:HRDC domain-containing protein [Holosporaceae bacterium]
MFLIDKKDQLDAFINNIIAEMKCSPTDEQFIAVDTEFIRENLEKPLLCLIQIAAPSEVFVVDPIAIDPSPLDLIFEDSGIKKVFHSAAQDLEILSLYGIDTRNFYDTQLYESILSEEAAVSYQSIVFKYLNKKIKKTHTLSDWKKRPLSEKQLAYSTDDVFYLREVYKKQSQKLVELERKNWLDDELSRLAEKSKENYFPTTLSENDLNIYNQLNEWREKKAVEKGVSPKSVVRDDVIKAICKKGADFVRHIKNSRNVRDKNYKEFLAFAEKIAESLDAKETPPKRNAAFDLLKILLEICSRKHSIAASVIAPSKELRKLIEKDENAKCLSGWRYEVFGKDAVRLLNGEISLRIKETEVVVE